MVNILLNNILVQRGLITHEQKWEDRKTVRTPNDEITVGTEHPRSDELKGRGRVVGARLKPDLVRLRRDQGGQWRKVVVDVKVTSTDKLNEAFKEKDDKYFEWTTKETREKKVSKAVLVGALQFRNFTIPQLYNSATFSFNTILVFWFSTFLDLLPHRHSSRSRTFHRVPYSC